MTDDNPALEAMRQAMKQAEDAAARRRHAKAQEQAAEEAAASMDNLAELALINEPVDRKAKPMFVSYALDEDHDLASLISQVSQQIPDNPNEDRDGDLVVVRHEVAATPWYQDAAEAALPAALRGMVGPVDVKGLLQAMLVEIGDVKRTNAIILEQLARMEEKVDRTNRQLKDKRHL
ncbi:MAG: hypothetical protein JWM80_43 [Cyanobacteria bacterium RYN_339]|nr:hypothetical protein [Cyanobacteria bacterium RYN_339]